MSCAVKDISDEVQDPESFRAYTRNDERKPKTTTENTAHLRRAVSARKAFSAEPFPSRIAQSVWYRKLSAALSKAGRSICFARPSADVRLFVDESRVCGG